MFSRRTSWSTEPNRLAQRLAQLRRDGVELLDLTESNPTRCGFTYDHECISAALADVNGLSYEPNPPGLIETRRHVANYYEELGRPASVDRIFLTTASSEAYSHCFRLLADPGEEILSPAPSYPLFDYLAGLDHVRLRKYPLIYGPEGWQIDLDALREAIRPTTRAILLVNPNNPTGSMLSPRERDILIRLAAKHDLALIVDEVFLDYLWDEKRKRETLTGKGICLTLTLSGLSKIAALPQMKLGWIVVRGPEGLAAEASSRLEVVSDTYLSVSTPIQRAAETLLDQRRLVAPQIRERVARNLATLDRALGPGSPVTRLRAEGGWYAVLRVPATLTDEEWAIYLLETAGVSVHPGHFFDFAQEGYLAVSLLPPETIFGEGARRLAEALR